MHDVFKNSAPDPTAGTLKTAKDYEKIGQELIKNGDFGAAEAAFRSAIELDSGAGWYYKHLARALEGQGRLDEALAALGEIATWDSYRSDAHLVSMAGSLLVKKKDWVGAEQSFRKAISFDPTVNWYRNALANVLAKLGQVEESLVISKELALSDTHRGDANLHSRIGMLLAKNGDLVEAEKAFRDSISFDSTVVWVYRALGDVLVRQDKIEEAISTLRHVLVLEPDHPETVNKLNNLLLRQDSKKLNISGKDNLAYDLKDASVSVSASAAALPFAAKSSSNIQIGIKQKNEESGFWQSVKRLFGT